MQHNDFGTIKENCMQRHLMFAFLDSDQSRTIRRSIYVSIENAIKSTQSRHIEFIIIIDREREHQELPILIYNKNAKERALKNLQFPSVPQQL